MLLLQFKKFEQILSHKKEVDLASLLQNAKKNVTQRNLLFKNIKKFVPLVASLLQNFKLCFVFSML